MKKKHVGIFLGLAGLLVACGGIGEPQSLYEEPWQPEDRKEQPKQGDEPVLLDQKTVAPQQTAWFPTNWFWRTRIRVANYNSVYVQAHIWCARYSYDVWTSIPPGGAFDNSWGCEGAEINVFNNAPPGSNSYLDAQTW